MKRKRPDSSRTLTDLFEEYYDKAELSPQSLAAFRIHLRRWERETGGPPAGGITNKIVARFRRRMLDSGLKPATVRSYWISIRAVLRLIGPPITGNPWGLGIIKQIPAMKPVILRHKLPRRIELRDLDHAYVAAAKMKLPRRSYKPAYWWQALLVMLYTTGLRIGDTLRLKWEQVNWEAGTLFVTTSKTGAEALLPLHPVALHHLARIRSASPLIFGRIDKHHFYGRWRELLRHADVRFMPHDVRRTACSEVDKIDRGMGKVLMLHAPSDVTQRSYLNAMPELKTAVEAMQIPVTFKHGPKMAQRAFDSSRRERLKMHADKFALPEAPGPDQWEFVPGGVVLAGRTMIVKGHKWTVLQMLAKAGGSVPLGDLWTACYGSEFDGSKPSRALVTKHVTYLRARLRAWLGLPDDWDPVPVATSAQWSDCTRYTLALPPLLQDRRTA